MSIISNELKKILEFTSRSRFLLIFIMIITFIVYSPKLLFSNYSIDTALMMRNPQYTLKWWLEIGRFGLVFLKKIIGVSINIVTINVFTYLLFATSCFLLCYIIYNLTRNYSGFLFVSSLFYLTSPIVIEQTNFILQSIEIQVALILLILSVWFVHLSINYKNPILFLSGIFLCTFAISVYPSFQVTYIALSIIVVYLQRSSLKWKVYLYRGSIYFSSLIFSMLVNFFLNKIILHIFDLEGSNYVSQGIIIGKVSLQTYIKACYYGVYNAFFHYSDIFLFNIPIFVAIILLAISFSKIKTESKTLSSLSISLIFLTACSTIFLYGSIGPARSLMPTIPLIMMFLCFESLVRIQKLVAKKNIIFSFVLFFLFLATFQARITVDYGIAEKKVFEREIILAKDIQKSLNGLGIHDYNRYQLAVIGTKSFKHIGIRQGDVIGKSFFEWDASSPVGVSDRVGNFLYTRGMNFKPITVEKYNKALTFSDNIIVSNDYSLSKFDDVIIIKFPKEK